ncbi:MAG: hypothetical protein U0031_20175 [Thermomicrobiales bacterium]
MVSRGQSVRLVRGRRAAWALTGTASALSLVLFASPALADETSLNSVASTGGVATATGSSSVTTGDIITGMNTGHSVDTGGTSDGDLTVSVDEMSSESNLDFVAEVGAQIADASGGDGGDAASTPGTDPNFTVRINNSDKNNNESNATGIGEGGEGGAGGDGGNAVIGDTP